MKTRLLYFIILILNTTVLFSQLLYSTDIFDEIGKIDLEECQNKALAEFDVDAGGRIADIALHPDGRLFVLAGAGDPIRATILELDVRRQEFVDIFCTEPSVETGNFNSLVCSKSGIFYTNNERTIYACNRNNSIVHAIGQVGPSERILGDLFFYNNELHTITNNNITNQKNIYKVNLENNGEPFIELVTEQVPNIVFQGLAPVFASDCSEKQQLGSYHLPFNAFNYIHEINMEDGTVIERCSIRVGTNTAQDISGLTSGDEFRENCALRLDLDRDDSSGRFIDHYVADSLCTVDFAIADEDVFIQSLNGSIDSLAIFVLGGIQHLGEEVLIGQAYNNLNLVTSEDNTRLSFINTGAASLADFAQAIRDTRFLVNASEVTDGERIIGSLLYATGEVGDTAKAFLTVNLTDELYAGEDAYVETCFGQHSIQLNELLGEGVRFGGRWEPPLFFEGDEENESGLFYTIRDTAGVYRYIVEEGNCADTAEVEVVLHFPPIISLGDSPDSYDLILCQGDDFVLDATVPHAIDYEWSTGSNEPIITITESGYYAVEIRDSLGCDAFAEIDVTISEDSPIYTEEAIVLCEGDTLFWEEDIITKDTTICENFALVSGCDSTHCRTVYVEPSYQEIEQVYLCEGEQLEWQGQIFERDTMICETFQTTENCDSTFCLDLTFYPSYHLEIDTSIVEGEVIEIAGETFDTSGFYQLDFSTVFGCDSTLNIYLDVMTSIASITTSNDYYVPSLVSPTSNAWNNVFRVYAKNGTTVSMERMMIYNIWGQPVFNTKNNFSYSSQAWDGRQNGVIVTSGIYFYHIVLSKGVQLTKEKNNQIKVLSGQFVLVNGN